jgi:AraC-like DNA-binding protein
MSPKLLKVLPNPNHSFSVRRDVVPYFYNRWHFHPEVELLHIEKGSGIQFMGDNMHRFEEGDVVLVGSGLPHYWRCDDAYFEVSDTLKAISTVAHFREDFWGREFLNLPENIKIKELLLKAKRGLRIKGQTAESIRQLLEDLLYAEEAERICLMLKALHVLVRSRELEPVASAAYHAETNYHDTDRMNDIYKFTATHYREKISLAQVAAAANISPSTFCRFFKTHTRKSYNTFLQELRVGHASKLLIENKKTITQICYGSGFHNVTNFYKTFKKLTGKTPQEFRKVFVGEKDE